MRFFSILAFLPILALAAPLVKPEQVRTERSFGLDNRDLDERDASPSIALERLNGWMGSLKPANASLMASLFQVDSIFNRLSTAIADEYPVAEAGEQDPAFLTNFGNTIQTFDAYFTSLNVTVTATPQFKTHVAQGDALLAGAFAGLGQAGKGAGGFVKALYGDGLSKTTGLLKAIPKTVAALSVMH